MYHDRTDPQAPQEAASAPRMRYAWVFWIFLAIALAFLALEHRAHLLGALPFLLLLACPLMHLFMHRGHGGHGSGHNKPARRD